MTDLNKEDQAAWRKAIVRDIGEEGTINIGRADDYSQGWNAACAYKQKSDDRLKEAERLLKLSRNIMQTSGLSPRHALYREISACLKSINEQEASSE